MIAQLVILRDHWIKRANDAMRAADAAEGPAAKAVYSGRASAFLCAADDITLLIARLSAQGPSAHLEAPTPSGPSRDPAA